MATPLNSSPNSSTNKATRIQISELFSFEPLEKRIVKYFPFSTLLTEPVCPGHNIPMLKRPSLCSWKTSAASTNQGSESGELGPTFLKQWYSGHVDLEIWVLQPPYCWSLFEGDLSPSHIPAYLCRSGQE